VLGDKINCTLVLPSTSYLTSQIPEISDGYFVFGELSLKHCVVTTRFSVDFSDPSNLITEYYQKWRGETFLITFCFRLELDKNGTWRSAFLLGYRKENFKISIDRKMLRNKIISVRTDSEV